WPGPAGGSTSAGPARPARRGWRSDEIGSPATGLVNPEPGIGICALTAVPRRLTARVWVRVDPAGPVPRRVEVVRVHGDDRLLRIGAEAGLRDTNAPGRNHVRCPADSWQARVRDRPR
ncbi:MAG TPA: hypothetical protein VFG98_08760, partial [Intrasporangium sp.]|nr:hypothetical protein [Intrasporangium sp.]